MFVTALHVIRRESGLTEDGGNLVSLGMSNRSVRVCGSAPKRRERCVHHAKVVALHDTKASPSIYCFVSPKFCREFFHGKSWFLSLGLQASRLQLDICFGISVATESAFLVICDTELEVKHHECQ